MSRSGRHALILTLLWFGSFVISLAIVETYVHVRDENGYRLLLPEERLAIARPILVTYALYLGGILAFWFAKPFKAPRTDRATRIRFALALGCTILFNVAVAVLLAEGYFLPKGTVTTADCADRAATWATWASFLVGPVNAFYFGTKTA